MNPFLAGSIPDEKMLMNKNNIIIQITDLSARDYPNISYVQSDQEYWAKQSPSQLYGMLFLLQTIRQFESLLLQLDEQKLIHGPLHSSIGQEAVAVGTTMALESTDKIVSTHRAHHHFLSKALMYYAPPDFDPLVSPLDEGLKRCMRKTLAEVLGLSDGWVGGRGGSMHLCDQPSGNIGTSAIVGGGIPIASGAGFAEKFRRTGGVVVCYFSDGAVSIGSFHEGINMAVVNKLPVIFIIENNLYAVATNTIETAGLTDLAIRASGFNIPALIVDGMNPLDMKRAVEMARKHASSGKGPVLIETKTYRYYHHSGMLPGSAFGYRSKDEERSWQDKDPLVLWPKELQERGIVNKEQIQYITDLANELVKDAIQFCMEFRDQGYTIKPRLWPTGDSAVIGIRSDGREFEGVSFRKLSDYSDTRQVKMVQAISRVIARRMETDPEIFILGEEVGHLSGGAYGATKDALGRFPERVYNTPIAESGFTGLALGAAMAGLKPVIEIMFPDFVLVAADQLFNHIGTARYMYGGGVDIPLIVRTRCSMGRGFGCQHSGEAIGLFALYPGWRIVAPVTPFDYIGMFNSAMLSKDPVLIIEHHELYQVIGPVPVSDMDYLVPMGQSEIRRVGRDVTVLTYLSLVPRVLRIAEELAGKGIDVEVIDLRTLDHANLDFATIGESLRKTRTLVVAEQSMASQSLGHFIAAQVQQEHFDYLDHPVVLVSSRDVPLPVSKTLEEFCLISDEQIRKSIFEAANRTISQDAYV